MELIMILSPGIIMGIIITLLLLVIGGAALVVKNLYGIIIGVSVLIGLRILINEIRNAISKNRKIYILNGIFGLIFSIFGFELVYEALSLAKGEVHLFQATIIYIILMIVLVGIMSYSHAKDKNEYKVSAIIHGMLVISMILVIPWIGTKGYSSNCFKKTDFTQQSKVEVLQDSEIYYHVDLSSTNHYSSSWYPIDLKISFGRFRRGTQLYVTGKEYGEYCEVTDGRRIGYIDKSDLAME